METEPRILEVADALVEFLGETDDEQRLSLARLLRLRLHRPACFVTLIGETSSGKTTLINALLQQELLPVSSRPTTGTVVHVLLGGFPSPRFLAIFRNATQEELNLEDFRHLCVKPSDRENLLRLQARLAGSDEGLEDLNLFDTPGYNSMMAEHEEILRKFLPESDLIIYVSGYRTGFGQNDQDMLEAVRLAIKGYDEPPVIVAVNRVPVGTLPGDRRIREILANAKDCLESEPVMFLIETASEGAAFTHGDTVTKMPKVDELWGHVLAVSRAPERQQAIHVKLVETLKDLILDADSYYELQELSLSATDDETRVMQEAVECLKRSRKEALNAVDRCAQRLRTLLPPALAQGVKGVKKKIAKEINDSNKWLGKEECVYWITAHMIPTVSENTSKSLVDLIVTEMERLDDELAEIGNTAVRELKMSIHLRSDAEIAFAVNLSEKIVRRLAGKGVNVLLESFGGVGGTAAGAGNLAKMLLKRVGDMAGKRFRRPIYDQIGRIFNKRMMARLNVLVQVLVEGILYIYDAKTWQGKLTKNIVGTLDKWADEVKQDLIESEVQRLTDQNVRDVEAIYGESIREAEAALKERTGDLKSKRNTIAGYRKRLKDMQSQLTAN